MIAHALERVPEWVEGWRGAGRLLLLLDFDGTLAPIVAQPGDAAIPALTRAALERLRGAPGVDLAIVSGRGLADARARVGLEGIVYAGNHGMEIEGPGVRWLHAEAASARPGLAVARDELRRALAGVPGTSVEDKGLTLSVHFRRAARADLPRVRRTVSEVVERNSALRLTEGKEVLEVRPGVACDKGTAVEFLLDHLRPPAGAPVLFLGDDRTDEDAFGALSAWRGGTGAGVVIAEPPPPRSAATAYLRSPVEVAALLQALADEGPAPGG